LPGTVLYVGKDQLEIEGEDGPENEELKRTLKEKTLALQKRF
jgi:hypothetical protein